MAQDQRDYEVARSFFEESLTLFWKIGNQSNIAMSLEAFARLAARESNMKRAALLGGAAAALREKSGSLMPPDQQDAYTNAMSIVRQTLDEETFLTAWTQGHSMPLEQAIEYALANTGA